jgi:hypothetical protein
MIELRCRQCGVAYVPTRGDLVRGPGWYRLCPGCRPAKPANGNLMDARHPHERREPS